MEFVNDIAVISKAERHHGRTLINFKLVSLFLHTHSAHIDHGVPGEKQKLRQVPGLTHRDIRLALKIEKLHQQYIEDGRAAPYIGQKDGMLRRNQSLHVLKRRYGSDGWAGAAGSVPPFQNLIDHMKAGGEWDPRFSVSPDILKDVEKPRSKPT
ncbi:hypothetical protein BJ138DRAFT_1146542 [Hygrophoropsis aurantiaca]|uniref:Uncharacterized protein n=1 Tax=Hygrophoropsis aurantiaca TaxID=72124 RepID=A0ACB8AIT3_9AGAM|nr:hypothetical protein BJ138DRAFT_1146542 [Hygrophoropsis aurantiaca]